MIIDENQGKIRFSTRRGFYAKLLREIIYQKWFERLIEAFDEKISKENGQRDLSIKQWILDFLQDCSNGLARIDGQLLDNKKITVFKY